MTSPHPARLRDRLPGASPAQAIRRFVLKGATVEGRASPSEYWWAMPVVVLVFVLLAIGSVYAGIPGSSDGQPGIGFGIFAFLIVVYVFVAALPVVTLTVRRLHDIDRSGWFTLVGAVPYLGTLVITVLCALPAKPAGSRFDGPGSLLER